MRKTSFYIINSITLYRLLSAPLLILLIFLGKQTAFAWMLSFSLLTDLVDGYIARHYKVTSIFGAKLDSVADDFTFLAAIIGTFIFKMDFIYDHRIWIFILLLLYIGQVVLALIKYGKITSFHTYLAKTAAILQGLFFISLFVFPQPVYSLFYLAAIVTILDLVEEIILVFLLPAWKANVKGLWWIYSNDSMTRKHPNG
jgi:CDP-diacylglycerol--glycerol-3-phosphate 3-phosphatidyltransferase